MTKHKIQIIKSSIAATWKEGRFRRSLLNSLWINQPKSKTLRQIVGYIKGVQQTNDEQEIFKMGVRTAYNLDTICDPNKTGYVKDEKEKHFWLELAKELFKNTLE